MKRTQSTIQRLLSPSLYKEACEKVWFMVRGVPGVSRRDIVQEAAFRVAKTKQRPATREDFRRFFLRCCRNVFLNVLRREKIAPRNNMDIDCRSVDPDLLNMLITREMLSALAIVNPRQAECIRLKYFEDRTNKYICNALNIEERTVQDDVCKAKKWLKQQGGAAA